MRAKGKIGENFLMVKISGYIIINIYGCLISFLQWIFDTRCRYCDKMLTVEQQSILPCAAKRYEMEGRLTVVTIVSHVIYWKIMLRLWKANS